MDSGSDGVHYEPFDGVTLKSLEGLFEFEQDFPNWREDRYVRALHQRLRRGVNIDSDLWRLTAS